MYCYLYNIRTRATRATLGCATWLEAGTAAPGTTPALSPPDEEAHQHHTSYNQGQHYGTECVALGGRKLKIVKVM